MATIPTSIGPIGARQINNTLYAGKSDLPTIQSAVNMAVKIGGAFTVVVPFDYAGSDIITAVTGGATNIQIVDERSWQRQAYLWDNATLPPAYRAGRFEQSSGFMTLGKPHLFGPGEATFYYDPTGTSGTGTAHIDVYGVSGTSLPSFNLAAFAADGSASITYFRCQESVPSSIQPANVPQVEMPSQLGLFNTDFANFNLWTGDYYLVGGKGMSIWAKPSQNAIDLQGLTIGGAYDQTIRLNYLGGAVDIGPINFDAAGNITGITSITAGNIGVDSITATDADFDTCEVANSPVRTFANTPDGPGQGMVWPPIGVPVSLGDHWQATSIDPATLATWPAAGIAVSTGTAWGTPIAAASLATWPAAGVAVSTGTAWGTPIATGLIALVNQVNTFTAQQQFNAGVGPIFNFPTSFSGNGMYFGWNHGTPQGMSEFLNQPGSGTTGFRWWSVTSAGVLTLLGTLSATGLTIPALTTSNGVVIPSGALRVTGSNAAAITPNTISLSNDGNAGYLDITGPNVSTYGQLLVRTAVSDFSAFTTAFSVTHAGIFTPGTFTAQGAKNFRIVHPLDKTKHLTHSCLEGPEIAVFYRGEAVTAGGWAEITLPDYFEALVKAHDRTVHLTALFEDEAEQVGMVAASRVKDGKFKVWSAMPVQKFFWEVKAVRGDLDPLEVETLIPEEPEQMTYSKGEAK